MRDAVARRLSRDYQVASLAGRSLVETHTMGAGCAVSSGDDSYGGGDGCSSVPVVAMEEPSGIPGDGAQMIAECDGLPSLVLRTLLDEVVRRIGLRSAGENERCPVVASSFALMLQLPPYRSVKALARALNCTPRHLERLWKRAGQSRWPDPKVFLDQVLLVRVFQGKATMGRQPSWSRLARHNGISPATLRNTCRRALGLPRSELTVGHMGGFAAGMLKQHICGADGVERCRPSGGL